MKKLIALCMVLAVSTTALCACSNGDEKTSDTDNTNSVSTESATEAEEEATEVATEIATEEYDDDDKIVEDSFETIGGVDFYIPDAINYANLSDWIQVKRWHIGYDYIFIGYMNDDTIYALYDSHNDYEVDPDSYDLEDVPKIAEENTMDSIDNVFPNYESKREVTVESEETITIGEKTYINQKGNIHLEFEEPEDTREISYTAYYTLDETVVCEKSPLSLILFSDRCEPETITEMDRIAEESLSKTNWDY